MSKDTYCVYCHTNKVNGKKYIGITRLKLEQRCGWGHGYNSQHFGRAIKKYGWQNFEHEILESNLDYEEAKEKERFYITKYKTLESAHGYNVAFGAGGGFKGHHHNEDSRKKISEGKKRYKITDEHKKHLSESKSGTKHHCAKIVFQYTKDGDFVREWSYMNEAAESLNIAKSSISATCKGKRKSAGGYVWKYERM